MSSKPTLYLLAAVAVLLAFGYFFEFNRPGTKEANAEAKRLVTFDRDKISGLTVTDHDLKIELQQDDAHHWRLKSPLADRADHARIDEVMTELETARVDETFKVNDDDKSKLGELGLLAPHVRLLVTRNDNSKPVEILFGNDTAIEGKVYARIEGTNQVAITSNELRKLLQKDTNAWRDHRAVDVATTDVSRFTIKNSSGEIELQRDGTHWKIAKPLSARGDDSRINDLLSQATNLAVLKFVADDKADAATYGLATPRGVLTLYTADNAKGTELMIGDNPTAATPAASPAPGTSPTPAPTPAAPENAVYIRQPARQAIFTVPTTVEAFLTLKPNDLRDHALARVNADTVDQVQITTGATPAACTLARKDQGWTVNGQPANAAGVPQLINALNAAQAVDFVADSAAPGDLARYGLDRPAVQVRFAAVASENTAESTAGEKPVATVDFGKEEGANVYARLEEEPFIVSVPKTVLGSVWADPLQWQPLDIVHADPEKITSLELAAKGAPPLALTRGAKGEWKTAEGGAAVDAGKVQSLLGTLSKLRAVRWVGGPSLPTYDLDNPENTLTFAAGADDKANGGKIHFGGRTAELTTYARMDGRPGVFLVSRPDAETLLQLAPVVPAQTPAPSPAATAAPVPPSEPVPAVTPPPVAAPEPTTAPMPTATPLSSPEPLPPVAPLPMGTATPSMTPVPEPSPTATPPPAATAAPTVEATPVPLPTITPTPVATPADIPVPAASPVP